MLDRTHIAFPTMNMVFMYFDDSCPIDELKSFMDLSLQHYLYLFNNTCVEVGGLGMSRSTDGFLFGYIKLTEPYTETEIQEMKQEFAELGWKTDQMNIADVVFDE